MGWVNEVVRGVENKDLTLLITQYNLWHAWRVYAITWTLIIDNVLEVIVGGRLAYVGEERLVQVVCKGALENKIVIH